MSYLLAGTLTTRALGVGASLDPSVPDKLGHSAYLLSWLGEEY